MSKCSYMFKYMLTDDPSNSVFTHKIRAVTEKEAYARFRHWINHRGYSISNGWYERGNADENEG